MKYKLLILAACGLALGHTTIAQCINGRCYVQPGGSSAKPQAASKYAWHKHANDPGRWYLYTDGQLSGGYDVEGNYYMAYDAATDTWSEATPPWTLPEQKAEGTAKPIFGVDTSKLSGKDAYTVYTDDGCRHISKQEAHKMVGQKLEDDSNKLRITVIGDDTACGLALADLAKAPDVDSWAIVRDYPPGHWALQPGFVQSGSPTIYCQAPTGQVLHRQDDYAGGANSTLEALRKAKSSYDARKDPDLRKQPAQQPNGSKYVSYALAAAAGAGVMHLTKRRKQ